MLCIEEYNKELNCREFVFDGSTKVFHVALSFVKKGEYRFHVINEKGENFDLVYNDNNYDIKQSGKFNMDFFSKDFELFSPFLEYDEDKIERLNLDFLEEFNSIYFTRFNEYTVILCKILLKSTKKNIYFKDERIKYFFNDERIIVTNNFPENIGTDYLIVTSNFFVQDPVDNRLIYDINLFNTIFFVDGLTDLTIQNIKYVALYIDKIEGIGSILINFLKIKKFFEKFGFIVYIKEGTSRYDDNLLNKYFYITGTPIDSNETNTIYITNYFAAVFTLTIDKLIKNMDLSEIVKKEFIEDMEEYRKGVLGDKKVLGLMVRGTDYLKAKVNSQPIPMKRLISIVKNKIEKEHYEKIFLATEDKDKLDELVKAFPNKIITIAQKRYSIKDFTDDTNLISDLEKKNYSEVDQLSIIDDTTLNYFYAIYILTKCDAFIATPFTNGVRCVLVFNKNAFSSIEVLNKTI